MNNLLEAESKQFSLLKDGKIYFQPDKTNPMPGDAFAYIIKGSSLLSPRVEMISTKSSELDNTDACIDKINSWLTEHIGTDLQALVQLKNDDEIENDDVKTILGRLYDSVGILSRSEVESYITGLGQEERRQLRSKKIRLGPVLVFLPTLNKPAAIHLKAMLYNLWNDKELPANVPADGIVSFAFNDKDYDREFLKIISYPVYGPRAIRVDMLDRLISMIYDCAEEGKFKAKHEMAELLGCSISDLYQVLEAIGHKKIYDPSESEERSQDKEKAALSDDKEALPKVAQGEQQSQPQLNTLSQDSESTKQSDSNGSDLDAANNERGDQNNTTSEVISKPELAVFRLKGGKAYEKKTPHFKPSANKKNQSYKSSKKRKDNRNKAKNKEKMNKGPRVISAKPEGKQADSPFAILKDLKVNKDEK